jgi:hypothetical protein
LFVWHSSWQALAFSVWSIWLYYYSSPSKVEPALELSSEVYKTLMA